MSLDEEKGDSLKQNVQFGASLQLIQHFQQAQIIAEWHYFSTDWVSSDGEVNGEVDE